MKPWSVRSSQILLDRRWLRLRQEHVVLPSGAEIAEFHVISAPDWVAALALTDDDRIVLVDQYRHGVGRISRELPAGIIEPEETPLAAAQRELREETGFVADDWTPLLEVATEPSRHTARAHFYFARGARRAFAPALDESEDIEVRCVPRASLMAEVQSGAIVHGVHVAAILMAERLGYL